MQNNNVCFILIGAAGSGKSTLSEKLARKYNAVICSTDSYFIDSETKKYNFDFRLLGKNHGMNLRRACAMMDNNVNVIIDNTNINVRDIRPYVRGAISNGFDVVFASPTNDWSENASECFKRCTHGVPLDKIESMLYNKKTPDELVTIFRSEYEHCYSLSDYELLQEKLQKG